MILFHVAGIKFLHRNQSRVSLHNEKKINEKSPTPLEPVITTFNYFIVFHLRFIFLVSQHFVCFHLESCLNRPVSQKGLIVSLGNSNVHVDHWSEVPMAVDYASGKWAWAHSPIMPSSMTLSEVAERRVWNASHYLCLGSTKEGIGKGSDIPKHSLSWPTMAAHTLTATPPPA